ncbi:hypothetical protein Bpfe_005321 [Biomphalaria pfeifferi]|uniref:Apple domain-containing protein n=1 Tax=Biomphalaria pfeifferi TaxID=112525 RepID=A0AAD8C4E9_BIOPF|nr:hypothetical protein Bpfe_005321 [Biomphalaria pfeifferi]
MRSKLVASIDLIKLILTNGMIKATFKSYANLSSFGQVINQGTNHSRLWCAFQCLSNPNCTGFRYRQTCQIVDSNFNTNVLNFSTGDDVLRKRKVFLRDLSYNPVNLSMYSLNKLPMRLTLGDMVYLRATLVKHGDVRVTLFEQLDQLNTTYEFRARCTTSACGNKYITISNRYDGTWNMSTYSSIPAYTLAVNETFEYHMLVTSQGLVTYLKNVYQYTLSTVLSYTGVNYVTLSGNIQVEEFSL